MSSTTTTTTTTMATTTTSTNTGATAATTTIEEPFSSSSSTLAGGGRRGGGVSSPTTITTTPPSSPSTTTTTTAVAVVVSKRHRHSVTSAIPPMAVASLRLAGAPFRRNRGKGTEHQAGSIGNNNNPSYNPSPEQAVVVSTTTTTKSPLSSSSSQQQQQPLKRFLHRRRWSFPKSSVTTYNDQSQDNNNNNDVISSNDNNDSNNNNQIPFTQDDSAVMSSVSNNPKNNYNKKKSNHNSFLDSIVTRYYETTKSSSSPTSSHNTATSTATTTTTTSNPENSKEDLDEAAGEDDSPVLNETTAITTTAVVTPRLGGPTAILKHSYLEYVCGCGNGKRQQPSSWDMEDPILDVNDDDADDHDKQGVVDENEQMNKNGKSQGMQNRRRLSEDPTVQESIECVFASQLQEGLAQALWEEDDDSDDEQQGNHRKQRKGKNRPPPSSSATLMSPASLLQSRVSSRSHVVQSTPPPPPPALQSTNSRSTSSKKKKNKKKNAKKQYQSGSLVHMGTYDPYHHHQEQHGEDDKTALEEQEEKEGPAATTTTVADVTSSPLPPAPPVTTKTPTAACVSCSKGRHSPWIDPKDWPQFPLLLKPSPNSGTRILGVRFSNTKRKFDYGNHNYISNDDDYVWKPTDPQLWNQVLLKEWGRTPTGKDEQDAILTNSPHAPKWCEHCCILPICNGNEESGKSLLIDFESDYFVGTLLLRLRHAEGTTPEPYDDHVGYFYGMNRRYQAVVQGHFKQALPWTSLVTGFQLERPCGKLPPKWILKSALKVVSFFAPQLDAKLDVDKPSSLTPLGSTPQVIVVHEEYNEEDEKGNKNRSKDSIPPVLDIAHEEPRNAQYTLLGQASDATTSFNRSRFRKRAFDKLYVQHHHHQHQHDHHHNNHHHAASTTTPSSPPLLMTNPDKIYTMEFLQHLFNFQDFSMELGSMLGSVKLKEVLDGQPIQFMACHHPPDHNEENNNNDNNNDNDDDESDQQRSRFRLWSFDIWHASLMEDAKKYDPPVQY